MNKENKILSIIVPCYEMDGKGVQFITELLESIAAQHLDRKCYEIIIGDHSINDDIADVCKSYSDLPIVYIKNDKDRGSSSSNCNVCISHATGKYIKPIFQDDFFVYKFSLSHIINSIIQSQAGWYIHDYIHFIDDTNTYERYMYGSYNDRMVYGINTIGPPSAVVFRNDNNLFDPKLIWLMDTDLYYRLYIKYGEPERISQVIAPLVANRICASQLTNKISQSIKDDELAYTLEKYKL